MTKANNPDQHDAPAASSSSSPPSEWTTVEPSSKPMGLVRLTLDKGVKTTVIGQLYGLDFEIEHKSFTVRVYFDNYNRRLKVLSYQAQSYRSLCSRLSWLAEANDFDKIFIKARKDDWQQFLPLGFVLEGILKYFYRGEDAFVMSKFGSNRRLASEALFEENRIIEGLMKSASTYSPAPLPSGYSMQVATEEQIPQMVALYRKVFATYPSPLTHPDYIQQTMQRDVVYRVVQNQRNTVVSAASAEIDAANSNAELTDCATRKSDRGKGLMYQLLLGLEQDLRERGIMTGYTLARAPSVGMNRVFYRLGYEYTGRLVNNCDIYGQFEDMNIWVKPLLDQPGAPHE